MKFLPILLLICSVLGCDSAAQPANQAESNVPRNDVETTVKPEPARIVQIGPEDHKADLFLHDDRLVEEKEGLVFKPAKVRKYEGNPVFTVDKPSERGRLNYTCVIQDREEGLFKMWYQMVISQPGGNLSWCHYAVSKDGVHWEKPNVGLVEFEGSKNNNILFEQLEGIRGTPSYWVMKDYSEPDPTKRYKMILQSWGFLGRSALIAYSPDGMRWTMPEYGNLPGPFDSQNSFEWDEQAGEYVGYFRSHRRGFRSISRATSPDAFHWSRPVTVHAPDEQDPPTWHLYVPGVFKYRAARNTYVMLVTGFDDTSHEMYPQLGLSRDGINWYRFREPFIAVGAEGRWDSGHTRAIGSATIIDGQTALFYYGSTVRGHEDGGEKGIGITFMDQDAFAGWHAADEGTLLTRPLEARRFHDRFYLIADAEGGLIRVELLNAAGEVLPGFSRQDCQIITGKGNHLPVHWNGEEHLESYLRSGPVRLKIYMKNATVYGFRCERPPR